MSRKKYPRYSREFKLETTRLAAESDNPATQVARELGLRLNQIYKWKKQLELKQGNAFPGQGKVMDHDQEIQRLKEELEAMPDENEFLKKQPSSSRSTGHEVCCHP